MSSQSVPGSGSFTGSTKAAAWLRWAVWPPASTLVSLTWPCWGTDSPWQRSGSQGDRCYPTWMELIKRGGPWRSAHKSWERDTTTPAPPLTSVWTTSWILAGVRWGAQWAYYEKKDLLTRFCLITTGSETTAACSVRLIYWHYIICLLTEPEADPDNVSIILVIVAVGVVLILIISSAVIVIWRCKRKY